MKRILGLFILLLLGVGVHAQTPTTPAIAAMVCANNTVVPTPVAGQFFYVQCDNSGKLITTASSTAAGITIGTSTITSGTNTRVLFDDSGVVGESSGLTYTKGTGTLAATTFSGAGTNITGTAAGLTAGSVTGLSITSGKTFTVSNTLALTGTDGSTLAIGTGGTLGSNAFTSTAYLPLTGGTLTDAETINLNAALAPTAISGTALQVIGADSVIGRVQATSFGAIASFTAARANGTGASPTAILSGDQIGGVNAYSYVASASPGFVGPVASYQTYATQNHTTTAMGSRIILATIPNGSTTLTTALTVDQDQSATLVGRLTTAGLTNTVASAASLPSAIFSGTLFTGGTATTTFPQMLFQPTGTTAATTWSTNGTIIGANVISGFSGNFIDFHVTGGASIFAVSSSGGIVSSGNIQIGAGGIFSFGSRGMLSSPIAGSNQFGAADAATVVAQTTRVQSVIAGTAAANGANWTLIGSLPTGTGTSGDIIWQTGVKTGSGTTQGTPTTALTIKGETQQVIAATTFVVSGMTNVATTSAVCYNTGTGLLTYDGTLGTCTVSDERLKNMGERIPNALDRLLQINGVYYTWKDSSLGSGRQIGVGAQTVEKVFPELVQTDINGRKSADYQRLTAPIIEALRELKADNDNLRLDVNELKRSAR